MITDREKKLRKKYEAEDRKIERMMERFKGKYGRNWTKNDLTPGERNSFYSSLRKAKSSIDAIIKIQVEDGRIKKTR